MAAVSDPVKTSEELAAELEAYNRAFRDCVGAYVELNQPHLLRVYEKAFLRDLVSSTRERCRQEASNPA